MKILVTGAAGFIGFHLSKKLLDLNYSIFAIDNLNKYYDINLKKERIKKLKKNKNFFFFKFDIENKNKIDKIIKKNKIKYIIHLAAQVGVRYSIDNPETYFKNNISGFFNILELSNLNKINHLLFASTSSVYGDTLELPSKEINNTDYPLSFYAATKKSNEIMAFSYSHIFKIPITALRLFTIYGPFGRPDMSLLKFIDSILNNKKISLYNSGIHSRDFTYIDDIVEGIVKLIKKPPKSKTPYNCFNLGAGKSIKLKKFIKLIEKNLGIKAKVKKLPLQIGDVKKTHSSIKLLQKYTSYNPKTNIEKGVKNTIDWYKEYIKNI